MSAAHRFSEERTGKSALAKMILTDTRLYEQLRAQILNYRGAATGRIASRPAFIDDCPRSPEVVAMHRALKATKSKHRSAFSRMEPWQQDVFIARVKRHGQKRYPNQQHMHDIYSHYIGERVAQVFKV